MPDRGNPPTDQAAGLRRLIEPEPLRSYCFLGGRGRVGTTSALLNVAAALADMQYRVLILDEHVGSGNCLKRLGLSPRLTLAEALDQQQTLVDTVVEVDAHLAIMPFFVRADQLAKLSPEEVDIQGRRFVAMAESFDILLMDARAPEDRNSTGLALAADQHVITLSDRAEAITDAYTFIKLLSRQYGQRACWLLANRVADWSTAQQLFARVANVAHKFTSMELRLMGFVPEDDTLHRANHLLRLVTDAFPDAPASAACRELAAALSSLPSVTVNTAQTLWLRLIESSQLFGRQSV